MVRNFGYVKLNDFETATEHAKHDFAKIFSETDYLQGGEPYYQRVLALLKPKKGARIIDLGYGRGFFLREAGRHGLKLHGLDFCEESKVQASKVLRNADLRVGDIHKIPFKDRYFDYVTCLGVIEHLVNPAKGVKEAARVLKEEGIAVFTIPNSIYFYSRAWIMYLKYFAARTLNMLRLRKKPAQFVRQPIDRFYTPIEGKELLEKNGLKVIYAETLLSKRQRFRINQTYANGDIKIDSSAFNSNFTLYFCKKA